MYTYRTHNIRVTKSKHSHDHKEVPSPKSLSRNIISGLEWSQHIHLDIRLYSRNSFFLYRRKRERETKNKKEKREKYSYKCISWNYL